MPSNRSGGSNRNSGSSRGSSSGSRAVHQSSVQDLIRSLQSHRVNTLTELCRIERVAASCDREEDAQAFQGPMTEAWNYYVSSRQFMTELRGLTPNYPFCGDVVADAHGRVVADQNSNRSWNLAWLILAKVQTDSMIPAYAASEAIRPEMWGEHEPTQGEIDQLAACFEYEWTAAISRMLRHWTSPPTWY
ncbi:hypothetical protein MKZ38_004960 [Zalerion maritima]|uniref:Uncharacterized protein n=1 Tax=Zalerion maritima TaxID=339359 RepID=A0AAD5RM03_9PEZI|nr:hypothetical protein MKZ38_004960 [Zalerion maritima]